VEETDRKIVSLLARNGRMSFTELARQAGLSVSAVHQRVRRLEQDGVIKGYAAIFNPEDVGLPLTAFVSVKPFDDAAPDDLPLRLEHLTAIEACHSVAGEENYILKVRVASPAALEDLLSQIRTLGRVSTRTTVVLSTPYENRPLDFLALRMAVAAVRPAWPPGRRGSRSAADRPGPVPSPSSPRPRGSAASRP
jgi:Lrp/AsnC family leucine-responsive transcriptional regulator